MSFQPGAGDELIIDGVAYKVTEHPAAPGMPYGQEGRQATVFELSSKLGPRAIKVFKPRYRTPAGVDLADRLAIFSHLPGLSVCNRTVLTTRRHTDLLRQQPELIYAVLMPWITGPTWLEVVLEDRELTPEWSLYLASSLAHSLVAMEERGLAHCDLSGPNIIVPALVGAERTGQARGNSGAAGAGNGKSSSAVELVDVEQMYAPSLERPDVVPAGSAGYAHLTAQSGLWRAEADRFAGALLISEMLAWCNPQVRANVWGEGFFDPGEVQNTSSTRYRIMLDVLRTTWGEAVAGLLERAWRSATLADCPTFGEWAIGLPMQVSVSAGTTEVAHAASGGPPSFVHGSEPPPPDDESAAARAIEALARSMEEKGNVALALRYYQDALGLAPSGSTLYDTLSQKISALGNGKWEPVKSQPSHLADKLPVPLTPVATPANSTNSQISKRPPLTAAPPAGTRADASSATNQPPTGPPSAPPAQPKQKSGAQVHNAGTKAPSYAMPPGVTSLATGDKPASPQGSFFPPGTTPGSSWSTVSMATAPPVRRRRAGWVAFLLLLVAAGIGAAIFWSMQTSGASFKAHAEATATAVAAASTSTAVAAASTATAVAAASTSTAVSLEQGATALAVAATGTAEAAYQATGTAEAATQATDTAVAADQATGTAESAAQATGTAESAAQATATTEVVARANAMAQSLDRVSQIVYGPTNGELQISNLNSIATDYSDTQLRNLIVEARFTNPYDVSFHSWDYGFLFRQGGNGEYRLIVQSNGIWEFELRDGSNWTNVGTGQTSIVDTSPNGSNALKLLVNGGDCIFFINNNYIATLDVSTKNIQGSVAVASALFSNDAVEGKSTSYANFVVRRLPDAIADAIATATAVEQEAETSVAAQETATAVAGLDAAATAAAIATIQAEQAMNDRAAQLSAGQEQIFGPENGYLIGAQPEGLRNLDLGGTTVSNLVMSVTFTNPDAGDGAYVLGFRSTGSHQYSIETHQDGQWGASLLNGEGSTSVYLPLANGYAPSFNTLPGSDNNFRVVVKDNEAVFLINGQFVDDIDVSNVREGGAAFISVDPAYPVQIPYSNLTVWRLP